MLNPTNVKPGQEQYAMFNAHRRGRMVQYDYRDLDGKLYSTVAHSVEEARAKVKKQMEKDGK